MQPTGPWGPRVGSLLSKGGRHLNSTFPATRVQNTKGAVVAASTTGSTVVAAMHDARGARVEAGMPPCEVSRLELRDLYRGAGKTQ